MLPHISVCICTYKRAALLAKLLHALELQDSDGNFSFSIVIIDNDHAQSARSKVDAIASTSKICISYYVEPEQNIAEARNCAMRKASGDYIAFIDDDEVPIANDWLFTMWKLITTSDVSGVLGPVRPRFEKEPKKWLVRSGVFDRPEYISGTLLDCRKTRTGNALVKRSAITELDPPFRKIYGSGGEDTDFFSRLIAKGHRFIWCNEAPVLEILPVSRTTFRYLCRRGLLRGQNQQHRLSVTSVIKSFLAVMIYSTIIPFLPLVGVHLFARYVVRWCDHAGKLCALFGYRPMGNKYLQP